jgi:PAS domain S-box-containing protein
MDRNESKKSNAPMRVLLLEPRRAVATDLKRALAEADAEFDVVHHTDSESALADAETAAPPYRAAVVSNALPNTTGPQICQRLQIAAVPAILLFDKGEEDAASAALLAGVDDALVRDTMGGHLKLLPGMVAKLSEVPKKGERAVHQQLSAVITAKPDTTEYKIAARSLRETQSLWRALLESPFQYFMLVDKKATIQYLNKPAPGIEPADVIGKKTIYDFVAPEERDTVHGHFEKLNRTGEAVHFDMFVPVLGQWYAVSAGPVFDEVSTIGASVFAREITEQKKFETQLKESEQRFRSLAESIHDVFYILDISEIRTIYVSPAYEEVYGRPVEKLYDNALAWMEAVHPDDLEKVKSNFADMIRLDEESYRGQEYRIVMPDGTIRWLHHRAFVIRKEESGPTQIAGVIADVTTAKEAEERLRESEQKYRTLVDQASDGIFVANTEGNHVDVNDAGCKMLGYTREEILKLNIRDLIPEEDLADAPPKKEKVQSGNLVLQERYLKRKDNSVLAVEASVNMLPGGLVQAIVRDITERKKAEEISRRAHDDLERRVKERTQELRSTIEAFEKAQRLASIGTLAAGIAHEINNPIGSILMAADTALYSLGQSKQKDEAIEAITSIKNDARRAGQIVKTVLQLSRQEVSHKWECDLAEVARRVRDITRRIAIQNEVHVELETAKGLPNVIINPTEFEQVLVNVTNNAIESSRSGQTVFIRLKKDGDNVVAQIVDNGRGMTREETGRIFDPFYTTRQAEGGTGLGLSLTYSIVRQHNGTIDVDSEPGKGTCVSVRLPVAAQLGAGE